MTVAALDSNILIYVLDDASPFSRAARTLLEKLENDTSKTYLSVIARTEILHLPYRLSPEVGEQAKRLLDSFSFLYYLDVSPAIADGAAELCAAAGPKLKNIDAIHLATALSAGAAEFWTNDRELAKVRIKNLTIRTLNPIS